MALLIFKYKTFFLWRSVLLSLLFISNYFISVLEGKSLSNWGNGSQASQVINVILLPGYTISFNFPNVKNIAEKKHTNWQKKAFQCLVKIKSLLLALFCFVPSSHFVAELPSMKWVFHVATVTWAWKQKPAFPLNLLDVSIIKTYLTILVSQGKVLASIQGIYYLSDRLTSNVNSE